MSNSNTVEEMFKVGAHYGYSKSRRHPTVAPFIFGAKNGVEIFDLEKIDDLLAKAKEFVSKVASEGQQVLFVSGKRQAIGIVKDAAMSIDQPFVVGRWIGGTITNFDEMKKRVSRLETLTEQKEKGLLAKYTKKERLLIDREIEKLEERFGGVVSMRQKPAAVFIVDSLQEDIALAEALKMNVPVVSLCNSDCDISKIDYPIVANDSSVDSIRFFVKEIVEAYKEGAKNKKTVAGDK
ncbi:30S ribosomal protein S2 [Candidatus Nomurabacteria bacterium]|nr:30S ribosomal protein S2 [Candidatus Nomurabacteria bacterium]